MPCSATGVLGRRPDARWRRKPAEFAALTARQQVLIQRAYEHLRPGGVLVYSTCSLEEEENEAIVRALLKADPDRSAGARRCPLSRPALGRPLRTDHTGPTRRRRQFCRAHPQRHRPCGSADKALHIVKNILRQLGLLAAAALLAGVIALVLLDEIIMPYLVDTPSVQVTPTYRAFSGPAASARLGEEGLKMTIGDSLHHETIPADAVVEQNPSAGQGVKKGRRIVLTVSKGPRYYEVPDVRRVSLREARLQLEGNQLKIGQILYRSSDALPEGAVVEQSPPPQHSARFRQFG